MTPQQLLAEVLAGEHENFAILHRPDALGPDDLDVMTGSVSALERLADIRLSEAPGACPSHETLVVVPHRQVSERGFVAVDDGSPLLALTIEQQATVGVSDLLRATRDKPIDVSTAGFDIDDVEYADVVRTVLDQEIATGEGSNFVLRRSFVAELSDYTPTNALTLFRRLLTQESGSYWTFLIHTATRVFVGATPERHVSLRNRIVTMNPISGTFRYSSAGPVLSEILAFLEDGKETDELYMVLDEELKMMAQVCPEGAHVRGPFLRQMARLAHTEYLIEGQSDRDPRDVLRATLLAPTVTGSPVENACRVVARHEPTGRGYYGGVAALFGRDAAGARTLDSGLLIRTADIRPDPHTSTAHLAVGVGATLVRASDPLSEVAETHAKVASMLRALGAQQKLHESAEVLDALRRRNMTISSFWLSPCSERSRPQPDLSGRTALVVDAEDDFSAMLAHQMRSAGLVVNHARFDEAIDPDAVDIVVMGPGPGDPRQVGDPKIAHLHATTERLLRDRVPFLAVCLSHQVLCRQLGLDLVKRDVPHQGTQRDIDFFGAVERVGFYNSFVAVSETDEVLTATGPVAVSRDRETQEVHALRGSHFRSVQFHLESVLTRGGDQLLTGLVTSLLGERLRKTSA